MAKRSLSTERIAELRQEFDHEHPVNELIEEIERLQMTPSMVQLQNGALRRALEDLREEKSFTLSDYEARALKRTMEAIGGATRWGKPGLDVSARSLCDGDWGHQIYSKLLQHLGDKP